MMNEIFMCAVEMHCLKFTVAPAVIAKRANACGGSVKNLMKGRNFSDFDLRKEC